jgi:hypothetical protein
MKAPITKVTHSAARNITKYLNAVIIGFIVLVKNCELCLATSYKKLKRFYNIKYKKFRGGGNNRYFKDSHNPISLI